MKNDIKKIRELASEHAKYIFNEIDLKHNTDFESIEQEAYQKEYNRCIHTMNEKEQGYFWEEFYLTIDMLAEEKGIKE